MGLHEEAVEANGDTSLGDGLDEVGTATRDPGGLVGLLQRVGAVEDYRTMILLHGLNAAEIDHQILIAEAGAALGEHHARVAGLSHLLNRVGHGLGRHELPFLDVDGATRLGCRDQQIGLPILLCTFQLFLLQIPIF